MIRRHPIHRVPVAVLAGFALMAAGCGDDDGSETATTGSSSPVAATSIDSTPAPTAPATTTPASAPTTAAPPTTAAAVVTLATTAASELTEPALRDELLVMFRADQEERTGLSDEFNDQDRADRLAEIVEQHGWPTHSMVGKEGGTAAWVIAQHADFDVAYQERMLALLTDAVDDGEADASEMAYLVDRVAVNGGRPQTYGTQVGNCTAAGAEAGDIRDEANVDVRRAEVGLDPLADYLAEMGAMCAGDG